MSYRFGLASIALLSVSAFAQQYGDGGGSHNFVRPVAPNHQYGSGFGRVVYPGSGRPPQGSGVTFPFTTPPSTFVERMGRSISGAGYTGVGPGFGHGRRGRGGNQGFPIVYPVPVFVGGEYYSDPAYYEQQPPNYNQTPNITIVMPPQQTTPPVTVNQYAPDPSRTQPESSAGGVIHDYQVPSPERPEPADDRVMFFIALKDSSVYTALAYWVEDGTLHYITSQGKHNQVSIDLVDRDTSSRLNEGRKVEFRLPAAR